MRAHAADVVEPKYSARLRNRLPSPVRPFTRVESGEVALFDPQSPSSLRRGRIRYVPVVPGRMEFAQEVRTEVLREPPQILAVELPVTLESPYLRASTRLPELSIIVYDGEAGEAVYLPVESTDPFVEALRSAQGLNLETVFLDPDLSERPHVEEAYPDSYAIRRLGLERYVAEYRSQAQTTHPDVRTHAEGVAWKLQGCDPEAEILVVVSLNLLDPLLEAMERPQAQPMRKAARRNVRALNLHPESLAEVTTEAPFLQAAYEAWRGMDLPSITPPEIETRSIRGWAVAQQPKNDPRLEALHEAATGERDRAEVQLKIFQAAERTHKRKTGEALAHWQRRMWARYSRNLALVQGQLTPALFDMTVAAQSVADDDFAWEFWQAGGWSPFQKTESDLATAKVSGEQMWVDRRRVQLRRRVPGRKGRAKPVGLKGKKGERFPGEWAGEWRETGLCSYPPEDIVIEDFGAFLKNKGKSILSDERTRVEPFTTSLRDGVDLRETLRNWHDGKRIYVRENQRVTGEVGAVVLIFDGDHDDRYPYCLTWLGEHQNESDMAFYATNPFENFVGPGIGRAEYGGLLLSLPSHRMADVWGDWDYAFCETKSEKLLAAALDYSLEKIVVYAADKPPRSIFKSIANRLGRRIVYVPTGQLSPVALKKIRLMHVLDGHDRREVAKDYI